VADTIDFDDPRVPWAAGFLDGEGCFTFTSPLQRAGGVTRYPLLQASQLVREPLDVLASMFEGRVYPLRSVAGRRMYQWHLTGTSQIAYALTAVTPFLLVKWAEAALLLTYISEMRRRSGYRLTPSFGTRRAARRSATCGSAAGDAITRDVRDLRPARHRQEHHRRRLVEQASRRRPRGRARPDRRVVRPDPHAGTA
jgi:hypothetical protein